MWYIIITIDPFRKIILVMGDLIGFAFGVHVQNLMETILIGIWDQGISVDIGCILAVINYKKVIIDPIGL